MDGSSPTISLLGGGAASSFSGTTVLLNGIPMNGLIKFDISTIPIGEVEKIEIIEGSGAVTYGDGSNNGIVNIITTPIGEKKYTGNVGYEVSSWKTRRFVMGGNGKVTDKLSLGASYSHYTSNGYRENGGKYKDKTDNTRSLFLKANYKLDGGEINAFYNHNDNRDVYTSSLDEKQYNDDPRHAG